MSPTQRYVLCFTIVALLGVGSATSAGAQGNCSIRFGSTTCATKMDGQTTALLSDLANCAGIGTETTHPISYYSWSALGIPAGCAATGSTTTIPVTVCFNSDSHSYGASKDPATNNPYQWTVMASCPGFVAKPVHLVIKSFHLDYSSMKASTNPTTPCSVSIDSNLVVANEGTADYVGGYSDALIFESCSSSLPLTCGGINSGALPPTYQLAKGASVTYTPVSTAQKGPFTVDCSPPSPNHVILGGPMVAKWSSCRSNITCDPGFAVATEDMLSVCFAAKRKQLLSACH